MQSDVKCFYLLFHFASVESAYFYEAYLYSLSEQNGVSERSKLTPFWER